MATKYFTVVFAIDDDEKFKPLWNLFQWDDGDSVWNIMKTIANDK